MNWLQLLYQYGVGCVLFGTTLALLLRSGAADAGVPSDRGIVRVLLIGFVGYFAFHLGWILLASR